ncbi:MAG TPA: Holliday junction branch migration protein RuvA [Candidatus Binataceae bacterium]|nr:Holliday junction branch migration protein RuvA [Candidatus Binataceae bacterium]
MIAALKGTLEVRDAARIVVATGGIGYEVFIPLTTFYRLPAIGETVALQIRQVVREDAITLYGFSSTIEKRAFDMLLSVQHVGPKLALAILSVLEPDELVAAIRREDIEKIDAVPGVGPKVAERVVRELRDKVDSLRLSDAVVEHANGVASAPKVPSGPPTLADDAVSALVNLGVKPAEAKRTVDAVLSAAANGTPELEAVVRKSLGVLFGEK